MNRIMRAVLALGAALAVALPMTGSTAASAPRQNLDGEQIEVAAVWTGAEQKNFKRVLDAFTKQTGVDVTFTSTGDDISSVLEPRIAGGDAPDVAILPQPGLLKDFVARGALKPVEDAAGQQVDRHYAPVWRTFGTVDDQLYGVWVKGANKSLVWYNASVFDDAGVKPTKTFDDLLAAMQTISDFGVPPLAIGAANGWTLTDIFENIYLAQAGPDQYDRLTAHEIPWTDQSVKDALTTMGEMVKSDWLPGGTEETLQTEFPESVQNMFKDPPQAAMTIEGDFVAAAITGDTNAKVGTDAKVFPFPAVGGGEPPIVTGGDVAVMFNDSPAAAAFLKFMASPKAGEVWAKPGGYISPNKDVPARAYPDRTTRQIAEALVSSDNVRFDMSDQYPSAFGATDGQGEWKLMQDFLANPSDVDGITQQLEAAASQALSSQ
jgi:ABC-type glycerol-3-phosphate transport system substrate-binding protein